MTSDYIANQRNGTRMSRSIAVITLVVILLTPTLLFHASPSPSPNQNSFTSISTAAADNPRLTLTYYTATDPTERTVSSGARLSGDHVTLVASWTPSLVVHSRLEVVAPAIPATIAHEEADSLLELDTRTLGNNATCIINSTAWLTNGSLMSIIFSNVFIGNFFVPKVTVTSPNGGEVWTGAHNITWTASDLNSAESLRFDVLISDDLGATYTVMVQGLSQTYFQWNSTGLDLLDSYVIKVRATDGIYFSDDRSDAPFTAGDVASTTTTSTTTTTTNGGFETRVLAFVIILLVSSAIMALIVYYAARKWF